MAQSFPALKWHKCDVPKDQMKELMKRSDAKGLKQTISYFIVLSGLGYLTWRCMGTYWVIPAFIAYGTVYCFLNHMMHETIHRTPFKSRKLNDFVHWVSSFLNGAEAVTNRYGHLRHHKVTYYEKYDPEVFIFRPFSLWKYFKKCFIDIPNPGYILSHAAGRITDQDRDLIPPKELNWLVWSSRLWVVGYGLIIASCFVFHTYMPLLFTIGARIFGAPLARLLDHSQHSCLEINEPDHRLCCRNIDLNPVLRFLYWNMNFHTEHHMFPAIPFHALPKMHELIKDQLPPAKKGLIAAYCEIIPAVIRQHKDPSYHITPVLPEL